MFTHAGFAGKPGRPVADNQKRPRFAHMVYLRRPTALEHNSGLRSVQQARSDRPTACIIMHARKAQNVRICRGPGLVAAPRLRGDALIRMSHGSAMSGKRAPLV
jgi:hypothetical protein